MVNLAATQEGQDMVRRDPKLRDTFPIADKDIATDLDRKMLGIPTSARISAPLFQSRDQIREWAKGIQELGRMIEARSHEEYPERFFLSDSYSLIRAFDTPYREELEKFNRAQGAKNSRMSANDERAAASVDKWGDSSSD